MRANARSSAPRGASTRKGRTTALAIADPGGVWAANGSLAQGIDTPAAKTATVPIDTAAMVASAAATGRRRQCGVAGIGAGCASSAGTKADAGAAIATDGAAASGTARGFSTCTGAIAPLR